MECQRFRFTALLESICTTLKSYTQALKHHSRCKAGYLFEGAIMGSAEIAMPIKNTSYTVKSVQYGIVQMTYTAIHHNGWKNIFDFLDKP